MADTSFMTRFGARLVTHGGVALIACGLLVIGWQASAPGIVLTGIGLLCTGVGMGVATGPLMNVAVGAVSPARSGTAGSVINVARMAGATLGVAVLGSVAAWAGGGEHGLRVAMISAAVVQLLCVGSAWWSTCRRVRAGPQ